MKPKKIIQNEERLLKYAAWYTLRYMPSRRKLHDALMKKSGGNMELADMVAKNMDDYIQEDRTIDSLVRLWIEQGKTERYIRTKLRERLFDEMIVEKVLSEYRGGLSDWKTYEKNVEKKILSLLDRNKSRQFIRLSIIRNHPQFSEEIDRLLATLCPEDDAALAEEAWKLMKKQDISVRSERDKFIRKLLSRWFQYDAIKKFLTNTD